MKNDGRHESPEIQKLQKRISDLERENKSLKDKTSAMLNMMEDLEHAKTRIEESETQFHALFDHMADGVLLADVSTRRFLFGNPQICAMLGYQSDEISRLGMNDIHPPDALPYTIDAFEHQVRGDFQLAKDIQVLRKNGSVFEADISSNPITLDGRACLLGIFRDITERKCAEQELRESEVRYRVLAEASQDLITLVNRQWEIEYTNTFAARQFGTLPENLRGRRIADIFPGEIADRQQFNLQKVFESGQAAYIEAPIIINGNSIWLSTWLVPIKNKAEEISSILIVSRDITERKRMERELRESEERFSALSESAFEGIVFSDKGVVIDCNEQLGMILGYQRSEILGMKVSEFIAPESRELVMSHIRSGSEEPYEHLVLRKDGTQRTVEIRARTLPFKGRMVRVTVIRDITERKRAEETFKESERKFRLAFDTSPDSMAILRLPDEVFVYVNHGFEQLSGYTRKEVIGKPASKINRWKNDKDREKYIETMQSKGEIRDFEAPMLTKQGEIDGLLSASIIDLNGVPHVLSIIRNITERKRAEEELKKRMDELESWRNVTLGREERVMELKKEVTELLKELGKPSRYQNPDE